MSYKLKLSEETDPVKIAKRREANRIKQRNWTKNNPEKKKLKRVLQSIEVVSFIRSLKLSCSRCGFNKHPAALDFHHKDSSNKSFTVSQGRYKSKELILKEIKKCEVICSNCHRIEHATPSL